MSSIPVQFCYSSLIMRGRCVAWWEFGAEWGKRVDLCRFIFKKTAQVYSNRTTDIEDI